MEHTSFIAVDNFLTKPRLQDSVLLSKLSVNKDHQKINVDTILLGQTDQQNTAVCLWPMKMTVPLLTSGQVV